MSTPTIFGREPAAIVGFIEATLVSLLAFGVLKPLGIDSAEAIGTVMAVVSAVLGVYVAYVTKDTLLGYVITAFKSGVALFAMYGYNLSVEQGAAVIAFVTVAFSFFQRTQTGPTAWPDLNPAND
jgi:hypothetical protein